MNIFKKKLSVAEEKARNFFLSIHSSLWRIEDCIVKHGKKNLVHIPLVAEIENVRAEVRAVVEVERDENTGKVKKDDRGYAITIHKFELH